MYKQKLKWETIPIECAYYFNYDRMLFHRITPAMQGLMTCLTVALNITTRMCWWNYMYLFVSDFSFIDVKEIFHEIMRLVTVFWPRTLICVHYLDHHLIQTYAIFWSFFFKIDIHNMYYNTNGVLLDQTIKQPKYFYLDLNIITENKVRSALFVFLNRNIYAPSIWFISIIQRYNNTTNFPQIANKKRIWLFEHCHITISLKVMQRTLDNKLHLVE